MQSVFSLASRQKGGWQERVAVDRYGELKTLCICLVGTALLRRASGQHHAVSPQTVAAYRDTFRLLLAFAETESASLRAKSRSPIGMRDCCSIASTIWRRFAATASGGGTRSLPLC
ncbi:hypothetical protein BQ8482_460006 [Mesorhizobium delmotii]|uniref:Uncharacterized protein n=1 Tax=Mesorhizobium delmotii TaxID=1631247 RepID=A0A2P9ATK6_9HYPH|nr:hypothetical protein BQ8482_460006 [Mesorhizobium delmotii]